MSQQVAGIQLVHDVDADRLKPVQTYMPQLPGPYATNTLARAAKLLPGQLYYALDGDRAVVCVVRPPLV